MADFAGFSRRNALGSPSERIFALVWPPGPELARILRRSNRAEKDKTERWKHPEEWTERLDGAGAARARETFRVDAAPKVLFSFALWVPCHEPADDRSS